MWQLVALPVAGVLIVAFILFLLFGRVLAAWAGKISRRFGDVSTAFKEIDKDEFNDE